TKAQNAGLTIRPLAETAKDTLAWLQQDPTRKLVTGLASEKSAATLTAWSAKQK
ncbi:MAG: 2'-hydroxyisoflavone reductase, partial [Planctomycetota bacterium]